MWRAVMTTALVGMVGCGTGTDTPSDADDTDVAQDTDLIGVWNKRLPPTEAMAVVRGLRPVRAVFHIHSPYSHDACDGAGWVEGQVDTACRDDLRRGLCDTRYDVAFITDHPDYGDAQPFEDLFHPQPGDTLLRDGDDVLAGAITCDDGHVLQWRAGFEDELMPVGLRHHVHADPTTRHDLLNATTADAVAAMQAAGAQVMLAHTEGRDLGLLEDLQDAGLHGVEVFNLHAMFSPDIRAEDLGLDGLAWIGDIGPFVDPSAVVEPDLFFLGVHGSQPPSEARWDALLARGPMMATGGTDAHENVLPAPMADGERADSYRRMLRWFSTWLFAADTSVAAIDDALAQRRANVVFEALGTPVGFDVHLDAGGTVYEVGAEAPVGTLVVDCPTLGSGSPRGEEAPEISVTVYKDGVSWQTTCGSWPVERGVYRVRVDMVPNHLRPFLTGVEDRFIVKYPWIYSGAIRVAMD